MKNVNTKGRCGDYAYGYRTDKKCSWVVYNRKTNEILDEVRHRSEAFQSANWFYRSESWKNDKED